MKTSATSARVGFQLGALFGNEPPDVQRPGAAAGFALVPFLTQHLKIALAELAARFPELQCLANDLAGGRILAGLDGAAYGIDDGRGQSDAQMFNFCHIDLHGWKYEMAGTALQEEWSGVSKPTAAPSFLST